MSARPSIITGERVAKLMRRGFTRVEIAEDMGVHVQHLTAYCNERGIDLPDDRRAMAADLLPRCAIDNAIKQAFRVAVGRCPFRDMPADAAPAPAPMPAPAWIDPRAL